MKFIAARLFVVLLVLGSADGKEPTDGMTRDDALKFCRTLDGKVSGEFWFEHGEKEGPYHHAGRLILSPEERASYAVAESDGGLLATGIDVPDGAAELHLDFFTGKSGNGWVTTHFFKPEVQTGPSTKSEDKRSKRQIALGPAAEFAIEEGNLALLKTLVDQGLQLNEYLSFPEKTTALSTAAWNGRPEIAKYLLKHGARKDMRARYGERPITTAYNLNSTEICKLLARPDGEEKKVVGVPEGVLEEVFSQKDSEDVLFLRWNGEDPPEELLNWLKRTFPHARPASRMETLDRRPLGARSWYRDKSDGKFGLLVEVSAEASENGWKVKFRQAVGPVLAGGGHETQYTRHYGYWMGKNLSSWDE